MKNRCVTCDFCFKGGLSVRALQNKCVQRYYKNHQKPRNHKDTACILQTKEFFRINSFFWLLHAAHSHPLNPNLPILS